MNADVIENKISDRPDYTILRLGKSYGSQRAYSEHLIDSALDDGGITLNTYCYGTDAVKDGYVVGGCSEGWKADADFLDPTSADRNSLLVELRQWLRDNLDADGFANHPYVGSWHNIEDNYVYVDFCRILPVLDDAIRLAKLRGELAIYDLANGCDINVADFPGIEPGK